MPIPANSSSSRFLDRDRRHDELRRQARAVVKLYDIRSPPVNLRAFYDGARDIRVIAKDLRGECDGLLRWSPQVRRFTLFYHDDPYRKRFNLAHELAHYLIDEHCHAIRTGIGVHKSKAGGFIGDRRIEMEADIYASELLIPTPFLQDWMLQPTIAVLKQVAERFGTSLQSAAWKMIENASMPAAVIVSRAGHVRWHLVNQALLQEGVWGIPSGMTIPAGTPSALACAQGGEHHGDVPASTWFSTTRKDQDLYEEALLLPGHETTLTFLSGD